MLVGCSRPSVKPRPKHSNESPYAFQVKLWNEAKVRPEWRLKINVAAARYKRYRSTYERISLFRKNGVPPEVIYVLHNRESGCDFGRHMHNGDPLRARTTHVPAGRIPDLDPPYTFEESAEDALYEVDDLDRVTWSNLGEKLQAIERFNGLGYQRYHPEVNSPYLWSGTTAYIRGKYVSDGRFDPLAVDQQLGCVPLLKRIYELYNGKNQRLSTDQWHFR